ncbi:MAG: hypothetical protein CL608_33455 [Anaerolineaceae bacterium]|nr:hypothetical protein [Anaerolineaceae bacterium]
MRLLPNVQGLQITKLGDCFAKFWVICLKLSKTFWMLKSVIQNVLEVNNLDKVPQLFLLIQGKMYEGWVWRIWGKVRRDV